MKKKLGMIALIAVMLASMVPPAKSSAELPLRVEVNGERIWFPDAQPFVDKQNRVQVPIRFISEELGAKVSWTPKKKQVGISQSSKIVTLTIGNKIFYINGNTERMDTSAMAKGSRTFVPLRFVSQALGAQVSWDSSINTVEITTGSGTPVKQPAKQPAKQPDKKPTGTKVKTENMYGFIVPKGSDSKLLVSKGDYDEDKESALFILLLTFGLMGEDHQKQLNEVEEVLRQKVNGKTVDAAMTYLKKKKKRSDILPMKSFKDSKYELIVLSPENGDANVKVYYK